MLLTPHTVVGVAIATVTPNPFIAVPVSIGMHFLGDLVPHWDYCIFTSKEGKPNKIYPLKIMADMTIGIGIGLFFTLHALWVLHNSALALNIFLCGIAAVLPDALTAPAIFDENAGGFPKFMYKLQTKIHFRAPLPWGLISQLLVVGFCFLLILNSTGLS